MKVILQQDIRGKGKRGQMIEVSDGYARNYMLPRKLAVEATADNVNTMRMNDKAMQEKRQREREEASAIAARMRLLAQGRIAPDPHGADACQYCPVGNCSARLVARKL